MLPCYSYTIIANCMIIWLSQPYGQSYLLSKTSVYLLQTTASLLHAVIVSEVKSTFYKINVHAALTPEQIWSHLKPAIEQANSLKEAFEQGAGKFVSLHLPFVTVCPSLSFMLD